MTGRPKYLRVRRWDEHQHYKTGPHSSHPAWIKFYVKLLYDDKITGLSIAAQLLADRLLLVAATVDNKIPNDEKWIESSAKVDAKLVPDALDELRKIRFLEPFSANKKSRQSLEQIREEKETPLPPYRHPSGKANTMDVNNAVRAWLHAPTWDETYDQAAIREELHRIASKPRHTGTLDELGAIRLWQDLRHQRGYVEAVA